MAVPGGALVSVKVKELSDAGATKVDGIYDSDPKKNPGARRYTRISYLDALQQQLKIMDSTAFSLCMDNKMPIIVFDMFKEHNLRSVVMGENVGTLVTADVSDGA